MVTVKSYATKQRKDGTTFVLLELIGGLEIIQSATTGSYYGTVRKCNIPTTFSEEVAKTFIGCSLPGSIIKVECDPYEFTNPRTGELMLLAHTYAFRSEGSKELVGNTQVEEVYAV
jgi:hypothetical protein